MHVRLPRVGDQPLSKKAGKGAAGGGGGDQPLSDRAGRKGEEEEEISRCLTGQGGRGRKRRSAAV